MRSKQESAMKERERQIAKKEGNIVKAKEDRKKRDKKKVGI